MVEAQETEVDWVVVAEEAGTEAAETQQPGWGAAGEVVGCI